MLCYIFYCENIYVLEIPEKDREKWNAFVSGTLAEINKTNTTELVILIH